MISRITGTVEAVEGSALTLRTDAAGFVSAIEVMVPAYLAARLRDRLGQPVMLHTIFYLEGQVQGTSFEPRLIGFDSPHDRAFFDLFTTVKGIGNRKALRAMAERPGWIAAAIIRGDTKSLVQLPEIGKKLAETMIVELKDKAQSFADANATPATGKPDRSQPVRPMEPALSQVEQDTHSALIVMGDQPAEAERKVKLAVARLGHLPADASELLSAALR